MRKLFGIFMIGFTAIGLTACNEDPVDTGSENVDPGDNNGNTTQEGVLGGYTELKDAIGSHLSQMSYSATFTGTNWWDGEEDVYNYDKDGTVSRFVVTDGLYYYDTNYLGKTIYHTNTANVCGYSSLFSHSLWYVVGLDDNNSLAGDGNLGLNEPTYYGDALLQEIYDNYSKMYVSNEGNTYTIVNSVDWNYGFDETNYRTITKQISFELTGNEISTYSYNVYHGSTISGRFIPTSNTLNTYVITSRGNVDISFSQEMIDSYQVILDESYTGTSCK